MKAFYYEGPFPFNNLRFQFELSKQAAEHNFGILWEFNFDFSATLSAQNNTCLCFGSEFKPHHILEPILKVHPLWVFTSNILLKGASYSLCNFSKEDHFQDLTFALSWGNHKSEITNERKLLQEDIVKGFSLALPLKAVEKLQDISVSPVGCQQQDQKYHLTHDQSFPGPSGNFMNIKVITEDFPPCKYG